MVISLLRLVVGLVSETCPVFTSDLLAVKSLILVPD